MKKLLLSALGTFAFLACSDPKTTSGSEMVQQNHENQTENHMSHAKNHAPKNEIISEMDEMMKDMHSKKLSGNNDEDYAEMMSDHHDAAVEMSEILIQRGKNEELQDFARNVIKVQNQEIALMENFDDLPEKSANSTEFQKELQASMAVMMNSSAPVHNDVDKDYAQQMIPHHQSAVAMAQVYKKYGKQADLLKLSDQIISTQNKEIEFLKDWLSRN